MINFDGDGIRINTSDISLVFPEEALKFLRPEFKEHYCYYNALLCCIAHSKSNQRSYYVEGYLKLNDEELQPHAFNMRDGVGFYDLTKYYFFDKANVTYYLKRMFTYEEIDSIFSQVGTTFLTITPEGEEYMKSKNVLLPYSDAEKNRIKNR